MMKKYVALRVDHKYFENNVLVDKYAISGQDKESLNWKLIETGFDTVEEATARMKELNKEGLKMYNASGYEVK